MSSNRHHRHRRQGGTTPTTEPQNSPGVAQFSVSEVAQFSVSLDKSLYKALSGERSPSFDTILKVVTALGLKLSASVRNDAEVA